MSRTLRLLPVISLFLVACGQVPQELGMTIKTVGTTSRTSVAVGSVNRGQVEITFQGLAKYHTLATTDDIAGVRLTLRSAIKATPFSQTITLNRSQLALPVVRTTFDGVPAGKVTLEVNVFDSDATMIGSGLADASVKARNLTRIPLNVKLLPGLENGSAEAVVTFQNPDGEEATPISSQSPSATPSAIATPSPTNSPKPSPSAAPTATPVPSPTPTRNPGVIGVIPTVTVGTNIIPVDLLSSDASQGMGPRFWTNLSEGWGVVLYFPTARKVAIWTPDMNFALDAVFVSNGKVVDMVKNMQPCASAANCTSYQSSVNADYILELKAGTLDKFGVKLGDSAQLKL